ncbi:Hypothetical predicted protein [Octopus vulgaris]|uniref:Uncharacterized protein n=1 Tax=Octopus vulgaris TaxID=6645 RepID=A0AA36BU10_OCTVU|nr:Hypothetical predicted protein [Octopus vulgaris]
MFGCRCGFWLKESAMVLLVAPWRPNGGTSSMHSGRALKAYVLVHDGQNGKCFGARLLVLSLCIYRQSFRHIAICNPMLRHTVTYPYMTRGSVFKEMNISKHLIHTLSFLSFPSQSIYVNIALSFKVHYCYQCMLRHRAGRNVSKQGEMLNGILSVAKF